MSDYYLIKRPSIDANSTYAYKTDVLASYGNKEDRIAQRDVPRIGFTYNYMVSDLQSALKLNTDIQKAGKVDAVYVPDWTAIEYAENVISGSNTVTPVSTVSNFADGQTAVLYVDNNTWITTTVSLGVNNVITFDSSIECDKALLMPLYACDVVGDIEITQINSYSYSVAMQFETRSPEFSTIMPWDTTFLGHDVWTGFCNTGTDGALQRRVEQAVQENDYEIGVRDRFTFYDRTYDSFTTDVMLNYDELPLYKNFIKRRYGKTYSFFIPSGAADFQKAGVSSDIVGSYLRIRNNYYDFSKRPYIVIQTDETASYAQINAVYDDNNNEVDSTYTGDYITLHLEQSFDFTYYDIDSLQVLYFVRLDEDEISFNTIGTDGASYPVYNSSLSLIETDFYDSSLIEYEDVWGSVKDTNTIYLFKIVDGTPVLQNGEDNGFSLVLNSGWENCIQEGRRTDSYCMNVTSTSLYNKILLKTTDTDAKIDADEDFVFQVEGKFTSEGGTLISNGSLFIPRLYRQYGYTWMQIFVPTSSGNTYGVTIKMNRWLGDEMDWHEWAVQRHNGKLYFLCDGLLCGTSEDAKGAMWGYGSSASTANFFGSVQQFRLAKGLNVYPCETDTVNDEYYLNTYSLNKLRPFDNATACIFDFKVDELCHFTATISNPSAYNTLPMQGFKTGDSERVRRCNDFLPVTGRIACSTGRSADRSTGYHITSNGISSGWFMHTDIRFEENYHHDFWFEFTMVISDDQVWTEQIIFPLRGIMVTAKINDGQYTIEAFGLTSGVYVDIGEAITFAMCLDSQNDRICTYINGQRTGMTTITAYMQNNSAGMISLFPLAVRRSADCETRDYYLHRLRIVEQCLTSEESYTVESEWTLGEYYTIPFVIEYGMQGLDSTKILEIKDIESIHPFAPFFLGTPQSTTAIGCNKLWSDNTRKTEVVSPTGNTLYTVRLTDPKTGIQGYGWYYVYSGYEGIYYQSIFKRELGTYDYLIYQQIPVITAERFQFEENKRLIYTPAVAPLSNLEVVYPTDLGSFYNVGRSLQFADGSADGGVDFLSDNGILSLTSSQFSAEVTRWGSERQIKQLEFVLNPPFYPYFYDSDESADSQYSYFGCRLFPFVKVHDSSYDRYNSVWADVSGYSDWINDNQWLDATVKTGTKYWLQWKQEQNLYSYAYQPSDHSWYDYQYDPSQAFDPNCVELSPLSFFSSNKPVHIVIQFVSADYYKQRDSGGGTDAFIFQQIEKIWINGTEYYIPKQWWEHCKSYFSEDKSLITLADVYNDNLSSDVPILFSTSGLNAVLDQFLGQCFTGVGGAIANANTLWSKSIACIIAYENERFRGDFDADARKDYLGR